jgi:sulfur-oxidizing protein SoxY
VNIMKRRTFLKGSLAGGVVAAAAGAGLLQPTEVLAADWPKSSAFYDTTVDGALKKLFGTTQMTDSAKIKIEAPIQAENGSVVRVSGDAAMNADMMAIIVAANPSPLAASVSLSNGAKGYFRTHVKMGKTSDVHVVVRSGGKLYKATQKIKVTVGGCGG